MRESDSNFQFEFNGQNVAALAPPVGRAPDTVAPSFIIHYSSFINRHGVQGARIH
jgi:hypothetical protein